MIYLMSRNQNSLNYQDILIYSTADQLFFFSPIYQPDVEALTWVRDHMLSFVKNKAPSDRRLFIDRESSSSKRIVNQKELMKILPSTTLRFSNLKIIRFSNKLQHLEIRILLLEPMVLRWLI